MSTAKLSLPCPTEGHSLAAASMRMSHLKIMGENMCACHRGGFVKFSEVSEKNYFQRFFIKCAHELCLMLGWMLVQHMLIGLFRGQTWDAQQNGD